MWSGMCANTPLRSVDFDHLTARCLSDASRSQSTIMAKSRKLNILMPSVPEQNWSCHSCGNCCRALVAHISDEERVRIDKQGWRKKLGVAPYVRAGKSWVLSKRSDGACVFLNDDNLCMIHAEFGETEKPVACRIFPFSVRPVRDGWQASLRFDCPSITGSQGTPTGQYRNWLSELATEIPYASPQGPDTTILHGKIKASEDEIEIITRRFLRVIKRTEWPMRKRLIAAARLTEITAGINFKEIRGDRLAEFIEIMTKAMENEADAPAPALTDKQKRMFRQLAFAHAEHVTVDDLLKGTIGRLKKRFEQLGKARRFLAGKGKVPSVAGYDAQPIAASQLTFEAVERVVLPGSVAGEAENLLYRYSIARVTGRTVWGEGYYGWSVFDGLRALWMSIAVTGWLARILAAADARNAISFDDISMALGMVDRSATRAPSLGTTTEKMRLGYLTSKDGACAALDAYAPVKKS